ncbi:helix-turn-helix domain-containing protein [Paracoccus sp. (in: a-proteobacteria)]|uniref:helix-turn-helix domain-containing protein n=1 Tax=Paracoccus sp. TaxID=267 RepID=UPI0026E0AE1D|nr:helix-turn-helix domain-containing protein [Paracoccus sp. (in: a-proteobacteria)]MDO5371723.1 helix-turn-helix domain-containing protein [Paracoccus sp. (in: a-proteobacteria)]
MDSAALILGAETLAGRLEGILLADPALARLWRTEASLLEAAASAGLEGERITVPGMVLRLTGAVAVAEDARATGMALKILSVARRPGDPFAAPVGTLRRIEAAAAPLGRAADRLEDAELALVAEAGRPWAQVPILAGWRAAADYALRSRRESPVAERLVFMAVEGAARHLRGLSPHAPGPQPEDAGARALLMPAEGAWVLAPSVALTRNGFRAWSPLSGLPAFLGAASRSLSHDLGHLGGLRHELARLQSMAAAARGRSRLADLVELVKLQPVVTSAMVMDRLGVTRRTALSLIGELAGAGCLVNLTARRAARFWALPSLAARMAPAGAARRPRGTARRPGESGAHPSRLREGFDEDRLGRVMAELDAAMTGIDRLLKGRA